MIDEERRVSQTDPAEESAEELAFGNRRDFLISLGKWSKAVIGGVILSGTLLPDQDAMAQSRWERFSPDDRPDWGRQGWFNRRSGWYNRPHWDRPGWYNRRPHWDRPHWGRPGWYNRRPGWYNRGWYNR